MQLEERALKLARIERRRYMSQAADDTFDVLQVLKKSLLVSDEAQSATALSAADALEAVAGKLRAGASTSKGDQ